MIMTWLTAVSRRPHEQ